MSRTVEDTIIKHWVAKDGLGRPTLYACLNERSKCILGRVLKHAPSIRSNILELGCNCGRDLEVLRRVGYKNLTGVDINADAIERIRECYPKLAETANLYHALIEYIVPTFETDQFDLTYTFTVLQHIVPEQASVFKEIARTCKYLLIVENEGTSSESEYMWFRDYLEIFDSMGCVEIDCDDVEIEGLLPGRYMLRVFDCRGVK